jgi:hypothetical protein
MRERDQVFFLVFPTFKLHISLVILTSPAAEAPALATSVAGHPSYSLGIPLSVANSFSRSPSLNRELFLSESLARNSRSRIRRSDYGTAAMVMNEFEWGLWFWWLWSIDCMDLNSWDWFGCGGADDCVLLMVIVDDDDSDNFWNGVFENNGSL